MYCFSEDIKGTKNIEPSNHFPSRLVLCFSTWRWNRSKLKWEWRRFNLREEERSICSSPNHFINRRRFIRSKRWTKQLYEWSNLGAHVNIHIIRVNSSVKSFWQLRGYCRIQSSLWLIYTKCFWRRSVKGKHSSKEQQCVRGTLWPESVRLKRRSPWRDVKVFSFGVSSERHRKMMLGEGAASRRGHRRSLRGLFTPPTNGARHEQAMLKIDRPTESTDWPLPLLIKATKYLDGFTREQTKDLWFEDQDEKSSFS